MSLKDCIARDIETIFLNTNDFCDNLTIQIGSSKFNVIGSLQSNLVDITSGSNASPLQDISYTLYIKYPLTEDLERSILSSGTRIMINNKSFSVVSVSDEMGLATIILNTRVGR